MPTNIVKLRSPFELKETAKRVFHALSVEQFEEHDSENYPNGVYYQGRIGTFKINVSYDDSPLEDFRFLVALGMRSDSEVTADEALRLMVVELLKVQFDVMRELGRMNQVVELELYSLSLEQDLISRRETRPIN